jgi:hypothetical protein
MDSNYRGEEDLQEVDAAEAEATAEDTAGLVEGQMALPRVKKEN